MLTVKGTYEKVIFLLQKILASSLPSMKRGGSEQMYYL